MTPTDQPAAGGSDADAIARSASAPGAFGTVVERHFAAVHAFAQRRVGVDLADEVTAETFARGFDARRRYDRTHADALPWLLGIASNVMRRHWRTERRRLAAYARAVRHEPAVPAPPDVAGELLQAVAALPRRQREVVLLYAWADLSYEEIARALDLPVGTVRSRLSRARVRLGADEPAPGPSRPFTALDDARESSRA
jgi:RNA polymerase sigma-70 factor (ECF subfamily)